MRWRGSSAASVLLLVAGLTLGCASTPGRDQPLQPVLVSASAPDGRTLAVSTSASEVALFDLAPLRFRSLLTPAEGAPPSGKEIMSRPGGLFWSPPLAFSPDGKLLVAAGADAARREIIGWNVDSGSIRFRAAAEPVMVDLAFFPDGRSFLTVGQTLKRWSADTATAMGEFKPPDGAAVTSVSIVPDGRVVLAGLSTGKIAEFDAGTGRILRTLEGHLAPVTGVAISPDGLAFASNAGRFDPRLWDRDADSPLPRNLSQIEGVGESIAKASADTQALVMFAWLLGTGAGFHVVGAPTMGAPTVLPPALEAARRTTSSLCGPRVAYSPDGRFLAASAHLSFLSGEFHVVLADLKQKQGRVLDGNYGCSVTFSSDSKFLIAGGLAAPQLWNVETGQRVDDAR